MQDIFSYIDDHAEEYLESLFVACRQPSISSQNVGIREMAISGMTCLPMWV